MVLGNSGGTFTWKRALCFLVLAKRKGGVWVPIHEYWHMSMKRRILVAIEASDAPTIRRPGLSCPEFVRDFRIRGLKQRG